MKKVLWILPLFASGWISIQGQDFQQVRTEVELRAEQKKPQKAAIPTAKGGGMFLGKPVTYGGLLVDLANSKNQAKMLSLRQPMNVKEDTENLVFDPRTGKIQGISLFTLKF